MGQYWQLDSRGHSPKHKDDTDQIATLKQHIAVAFWGIHLKKSRLKLKNVRQRKVTAENLRADFPTVKRLAGVTTTKKLFYEDLEGQLPPV